MTRYNLLLAIILQLNSQISFARENSIIIEFETTDDVERLNYAFLGRGIDELHYSATRFEKYLFKKKDANLYSVEIQALNPVILSEFSTFPIFETSLVPCLVNPGDSIHIKKIDGKYYFSGRGADAFSILSDFSLIRIKEKPDSVIYKAYKRISSADEYFSLMNFCAYYQKVRFGVLDRYKSTLPPINYLHFKSFFLGEFYLVGATNFLELCRQKEKLGYTVDNLSSFYDRLMKTYGEYFEEPTDSFGIIPPVTGLEQYARLLYLKSLNFWINTDQLPGWVPVYYYIKKRYEGVLQKRLLTHIVFFRLIEGSYLGMEGIIAIKDFLNYCKDPAISEFIQNRFKRKFGYVLGEIRPSLYADGPFVFYSNGSIVIKSLEMDADSLNEKKRFIKPGTKAKFIVKPKGDKPFTVLLKNKMLLEQSDFKVVSKLFVVSDIEGEFARFKSLLQGNRIIDKNLNWIFGSGHLVLVGDFVDRGDEVTEVLWLIYSLEAKAKAAGGYVHFILGNHEIMNLSGSLNYVHFRYKEVARLLKEDYSKGLLGENSELGRWLRTKNVIEKIGDLLFLHGGVSTEINRLPISVTKINELARPNYAVNSGTSKEEATIMSSTVGPFWSRFYFRIRSEKDKEKVLLTIDSTLEKFKVNRIVTGHTIVADTISVHYGGKVINVDTHHAEGKSEALLIDGGEFYRVNAEGKKVLLFIDDKRKLN